MQSSIIKKIVWSSLLLLSINLTVNGQLKLSVYTDKPEYSYGEKITIYCKFTNVTDSNFSFLSGTTESCQAEFQFNDFSSSEHTICLLTSELLEFPPHSSKIYSWIVDPMECGLPDKDGEQTIIGEYAKLGLSDTVYINAPLFLGGKIAVGYTTENSDSVQALKTKLNVTVIDSSVLTGSIAEVWQIKGYQIDTLLNRLSGNNRLTYAEKQVTMLYDKRVNQSDIDFYPLHLGDMWQYFAESKAADGKYDSHYFTTTVTGLDTLGDKVYFKTAYSDLDCMHYYHIDSTKATVLQFVENEKKECLSELLYLQPGELFLNNCELFIGSQSEKFQPVFNKVTDVKTFKKYPAITCQFVPRTTYELAEGIGVINSKTVFPAPTLPYATNEYTLVYAKVNGVEYGSFVPSYVNAEINLYPLHVGDYWIYNVEFSEGGSSGKDTVKVTGLDTLNYKIYYVVESLFGERRLLRIDSAKATVIENIGGDEKVAEYLASKKGDTLLNNATMFWKCLQDSIVEFSGERRNMKTFKNKNKAVVTSGCLQKEYSFISGIGMNYYEDVFRDATDVKRTAHLTEANINGVKYYVNPNGTESQKITTLQFNLEQNYPNPFNPSTTIEYTVPTNTNGVISNVTLKVYDILGREIETLVNTTQRAGNYKAVFNAGGLSSGIYFYRLQAGKYSAVKKMFLIK